MRCACRRSLSADFTRTVPCPATTSRVHRSAARARTAARSRRSEPRTSARPAPFKNTRSMIRLRKIICATVAAADRIPSATAVPTKRRADRTCRKSSPFNERPGGLVPIVLQTHLAAKEAVDEDEVDRGEHHADAPPRESDSETVSGAGGVVDGQAVLRLHGGQDVRVDCEGGGGHHARNVSAGGEKGGPVAPLEAEVPHEGESDNGEGGEDDSPRSLGEAGEHLGSQGEGCGGGDRRQGHQHHPADPGGAPGAGIQLVLGLHDYPAGAVND